MFSQQVTTKNGVVKTVVAQNQEELDEAVKAAKAEQSAVAPDIHDPKDGNKIVSPDNLHTEVVPSTVDNSVEEVEEPKKAEKTPAKKTEDEKVETPEPKVVKHNTAQEFTDVVPATKTSPEVPPKVIKK